MYHGHLRRRPRRPRPWGNEFGSQRYPHSPSDDVSRWIIPMSTCEIPPQMIIVIEIEMIPMGVAPLALERIIRIHMLRKSGHRDLNLPDRLQSRRQKKSFTLST